MLIHPWDAALDDAEWQEWLADTGRFGALVVNNLDPAHAPMAGYELLVDLARPHSVWRHQVGRAATQQRRLAAIGEWRRYQ